MRAWAVETPGPIDAHPLVPIERADPLPGMGEVRVAVAVCGVCRTDLHLAEGDLAPRRRHVVPGHEVVGVVDAVGPITRRFAIGDRVGVPWLGATCGSCRFCTSGRENLCISPTFTGWDVDGGYAPYVVAKEDYLYAIPETYSDEEAAPLLCAGIIGYRSLMRTGLAPRGRLGIYGFGASAHLTAQLAIARDARVHVMTRSATARDLALELGAKSASDVTAAPPEPLDAVILFAPVGSLVPIALAALDRGGTLVVAGIHLSDIPALRYVDSIFPERDLRSVTANTRRDGEAFFDLARSVKLRVATTSYPLEQVNTALTDVAHDRVTGVAVLRIAKRDGAVDV